MPETETRVHYRRWNMEPEQLETMGFLRLDGDCVIEVSGESGTCYIDFLVVSKNFRQCVKNMRADKSALWSVHVAIAFDVMRKPSKNQTWQLVTPPPLVPQAPFQCREKWLERR